MANLINSQPYPGTEYYTLDTTGTVNVGNAVDGKVGSFVLQVEGSTWTGSIVLKARVLGAGSANMGWVSVAYQNLATGADVTGGDDIAADGLFAVRCDHSMELQLDYTHTAGSVKVLVSRGIG